MGLNSSKASLRYFNLDFIMMFSFAASIVLLLRAVNALPASLEQRDDPESSPITVCFESGSTQNKMQTYMFLV